MLSNTLSIISDFEGTEKDIEISYNSLVGDLFKRIQINYPTLYSFNPQDDIFHVSIKLPKKNIRLTFSEDGKKRLRDVNIPDPCAIQVHIDKQKALTCNNSLYELTIINKNDRDTFFITKTQCVRELFSLAGGKDFYFEFQHIGGVKTIYFDSDKHKRIVDIDLYNGAELDVYSLNDIKLDKTETYNVFGVVGGECIGFNSMNEFTTVEQFYREMKLRFRILNNYSYENEDYCLYLTRGDEKYYVRYKDNDQKTLKDVGVGDGCILIAELANGEPFDN